MEIIAFTDGFNTYNKYNGEEGKGRFSINLTRWYELDDLLKNPNVHIKTVKSNKTGKSYTLGDTLEQMGKFKFILSKLEKENDTNEIIYWIKIKQEKI